MKSTYAELIDSYLKKSLKYGINFDVIRREVGIGKNKGLIYYLSSLVSEVSLSSMLEGILNSKTSKNITELLLNGNGYLKNDQEEILRDILNGVAAYIIYSKNEVVMIDVRYYQSRSVSEPNAEQTIRGSKDGFVESININVGLIRRRIKDKSFVVKNFIVSNISKTNVSLLYLDTVVDKEALLHLERRLLTLDIDSLVMSDRALEQKLFNQKYNPFPLVKYTERPDIASISIIKGKIIIIVDTTSSVIITPCTLIDHTYHVEEFTETPLISAFTRVTRNIAMFLSFTILPFYLAIIDNDGYRNGLYSKMTDKFNLVVIQMIIGEFLFELLRIASIHTPSPISGTIGLIAAVILSQVALDLGLFLPEIILLCAISSICQFATPSYELSLANKFTKIILIILVALLGKIGLLLGITFLFLYLSNISIFNKPYLYPFCPLDVKKALGVFIRPNASNSKKL